jgi:hypothetical protein
MISRILTLIIFSFSLVISGVTVQATPPTEEQQEVASQKLNAAIDAAKSWLLIVDDRRYRESWKEAAQYFKDKVPEDQWESSLKQVRSSYGKVISREVSHLQYTTYMPGAPIGEYAIIQFKTKFENRDAVETITPMLDNGTWRVSGYYLK